MLNKRQETLINKMNNLLDRDLTYFDNVAQLRFNSHMQAINEITELRNAIKLELELMKGKV
jgi:hypothetical protein